MTRQNMHPKQYQQEKAKMQNKSSKQGTGNEHKKKYVRRSPGAEQPDFFSGNLQSVFSANVNMARANTFNVLCYISAQCGLKVDCDEENMHRLKVVRFADKVKLPEQQERIFKLLMRHFPILQYMSQSYITKAKPASKGKDEVKEKKQVEYKDLQQIMEDILGVLTFKRNLLTHADHYDTNEEIADELEREQRLFSPLNYAFLGCKREAKRVYKFTKNDLNFIDQDERVERTNEKNADGKPIYRERPDWFFRLYDVKELENGNKEFTLTPAGLTFLLCKLLHKKYASQLAQQTGLFRSTEQKGSSPFQKNENEAMFTIFCMRRVRLPKGRMESTADSSALGLDMLNELQKCPAELFKTFSTADQKLFQVLRKDGSTTPAPDDDINLFRRHDDRFPQFALRYIDAMRTSPDQENRVLDKIVFQVALGKFRYKFYECTSLDADYLSDEEKYRVRVLQKEINGFGPLNKVEELRTSEEYYGSLIRPVSDDPKQLYDADTAETKPYLTDQHATYAITGNRIGLMWNDSEKGEIKLDGETLCFLPKLPMQQQDGGELKLSEIENNKAPLAWLSIHDLPSLIFLNLLGGDPEAVIKHTYGKLRKLLLAIQRGELLPQGGNYTLALSKFQLDPSDVPDKIIEFLKSKPVNDDTDMATYEKNACTRADMDFVKWAEKQLDGNDNPVAGPIRKGVIRRLEERIERFKERRNMVGDKTNRVGRQNYVEVRPGALARILAKDIMEFTRPDTARHNNGKPNAPDYAVLTAAIAQHKSNDNRIPLAECKLGVMLKKAINVANHPFLGGVLSQPVKDTSDFYLKYLGCKLKFLRNLRKDCNYKDQWFLRESYRNLVAKTPSYMKGAEGLAKRYFDTLQLPDGLFDKAIRKILKEGHPAIGSSDKEGVQGISHLIYAWFTKVQHDKSQPFYRNDADQYKRHYKLLDALYPLVTPSVYTPETIWPERFFTDNEIATKLKKGNAAQTPVRRQMDAHINNLKEKKNKPSDPQRKRMEPQYGPANKQKKDEVRTKLMHQLRDLQRNERTIRRYRNEDILLFMMAKRLLLSGGVSFGNANANAIGLDAFKLQNILPPACEGKDNILNQTVSFSLSFDLVNEKMKFIEEPKGSRVRRTIVQDDLKLKNYGDFYSFLYDGRIGSLLKQMPKDIPVSRKELEEELDSYDRKRHEVFATIQAIERRIITLNPQVKDPGAEGFIDLTKNKPYRNSFSSLLSLCKKYLDDGGNPTDVSNLLAEIRNAFSHNRYVVSSGKQLNISMLSLPNVSQQILAWLKTQMENI